MKKIDMGKYVFLAGNNATEIFDYYKVDEMHGLNRKDAQAEEVDKTVGNGVYIYGWTNYDPADKKLTAKSTSASTSGISILSIKPAMAPILPTAFSANFSAKIVDVFAIFSVIAISSNISVSSK